MSSPPLSSKPLCRETKISGDRLIAALTWPQSTAMVTAVERQDMLGRIRSHPGTPRSSYWPSSSYRLSAGLVDAWRDPSRTRPRQPTHRFPGPFSERPFGVSPNAPAGNPLVIMVCMVLRVPSRGTLQLKVNYYEHTGLDRPRRSPKALVLAWPVASVPQ